MKWRAARGARQVVWAGVGSELQSTRDGFVCCDKSPRYKWSLSQLRGFAALVENLDLIPSTHVLLHIHNCLHHQFQGDWIHLFWTLGMQAAYRHTCRLNPSTKTKKKGWGDDKQDSVAHACNPVTQEVEAEASGIQGHPSRMSWDTWDPVQWKIMGRTEVKVSDLSLLLCTFLQSFHSLAKIILNTDLHLWPHSFLQHV